MPTTRRDDPTELLRQALEGLDAHIAELQQTRAQLVALLDKSPSAASAVEAATPQKRQRSAAWRAKLSAAAKARWTKVRKAKAAAQKPKKAAKKTQSKAKPAKTRSTPPKKKTTPTKKAKAKKSPAKKTLALQGKEIGKPKTRKPDVNTPAGIVERLALAGARFRFTQGGSLIIGNLGSLPPDVQRMFLDHPNPRLLTAAARQYLVSGTQSSEE
jgi:hypothetical protein